MATLWSEFRVECEEAYKAFLAGRPEQIQHHNLIRDGDIELDFVFGLLGLGAPGPGSAALTADAGGGTGPISLLGPESQVPAAAISEPAIPSAGRQFPEPPTRSPAPPHPTRGAP